MSEVGHASSCWLRGNSIQFAPLGGDTFVRAIPEDNRSNLPDNIVVRTENSSFALVPFYTSCIASVVHGISLLNRAEYTHHPLLASNAIPNGLGR